MAEIQKPNETVDIGVSSEYKYGFHDDVKPVFKSRKGLDTEVINEMCDVKEEPDWMREYRLKAYDIFKQKPDLKWGGDLSDLDYDDIYYYVKASDRVERSWDDVPDDIKKTFDRLGIPEAERKFPRRRRCPIRFRGRLSQHRRRVGEDWCYLRRYRHSHP